MLHPAHEFRTHIDTALDRVRDMKPTLDKALADIHALRDILGVPDAMREWTANGNKPCAAK